MTVGKGKRPRDPNQLAKWLVDSSTSDTPLPDSMGRKGGQIGGKRRLVTMTAAQRKKAAVKAAKARWNARREG